MLLEHGDVVLARRRGGRVGVHVRSRIRQQVEERVGGVTVVARVGRKRVLARHEDDRIAGGEEVLSLRWAPRVPAEKLSRKRTTFFSSGTVVPPDVTRTTLRPSWM